MPGDDSRRLTATRICAVLGALLFLLGASILGHYFSRPPGAERLEVSFFLHLDKQRDYWVGDLLKFHARDGRLLALLSRYSGTQSSVFPGPRTLSLDLADTGFAHAPLKRKDFLDLGRPAGNATYLSFIDDKLVAYSFGKLYCKDRPHGSWVGCGSLRDMSHMSSPGFSKLVDYINSVGEDVFPAFIGSTRVLLVWRHSGLSDCSMMANRDFKCVRVENTGICPAIFVYGVFGNLVSLYCVNGDKYTYDLATKEVVLVTPAHAKGISNQFYASHVHGDHVYLGQYPSGGLFIKSGMGESLAAPPPVRRGFSPLNRELQSIGYIGGKLLVGVWPWGEVWEASLGERSIDFTGHVELFDSRSEVESGKDHPFENKLPPPYDYNELGRRVSSIVPCWGGVCVSTASKFREIRPEHVPDRDILQEYGRVYYLPGPKSSCSLELGGAQYLVLTLERKSATLVVDGETRCTFTFEGYDLSKVIRETDRVSVGSSFAEKNGHSGQVRTFLRR